MAFKLSFMSIFIILRISVNVTKNVNKSTNKGAINHTNQLIPAKVPCPITLKTNQIKSSETG